MADITLANESSVPSTPASGYASIYPDANTKSLVLLNDAGTAQCLRVLTNANTGDVSAASADTYLTGSKITVPLHKLKQKAILKWRFIFTKGASGTATPIWNIRIGTAGTTSDSSVVQFTTSAQTNVADTGLCEIGAIIRTAGASGVVQGMLRMTHNNQTTGISVQQYDIQQVLSGTVDLSVANLLVGVSCNPGDNTWTFQIVAAEAWNL